MPKAIDMHVHPGTPEYVLEAGGEFHRHAFECLGGALETTTAEGMAELYRRLDVMAVVYAWDAETATGLPRVSNDYVAQLVRDFPDVFLGFACVDPWKGVMAIKELERAVRELGLRGAKFQPIAQRLFPNDRRFYPLWECCAKLRIPVVFHVGMTGLGAGHDPHRHPSGLAVARRDARHRPPQDERLLRPFRLVAEVLPAQSREVRGLVAARSGALRLGLSVLFAGASGWGSWRRRNWWRGPFTRSIRSSVILRCWRARWCSRSRTLPPVKLVGRKSFESGWAIPLSKWRRSVRKARSHEGGSAMPVTVR